MKKINVIGLIGLIALVGCSDNIGSAPGEDDMPRDYYYRVDVPDGFSADILYFYHEDPDSIRKSTDLLKEIQGLWETDTYSVNPLSRTPDAELRITKTRKIDYTQDIAGELKAQIIVDGETVVDTVWQLPAGNGSFSIGYDFAIN